MTAAGMSTVTFDMFTSLHLPDHGTGNRGRHHQERHGPMLENIIF
jgi:hypothetical protein